MKLKRYFFDGALKCGQTVTVDGEEFNHMAVVMRTKVGDKVELFCGDGNNYLAEVKQIAKKFAVLSVDNVEPNECEPKLKVDVYQALAKGDKLSLIAQKITELGASGMMVFESKFCDVKSNTGKLDRLKLVSVSAAKQCGRSSILNIPSVLSLKDVAQNIKNYDKFFVFYEAEDGTNFAEELLKIKSENLKNIAIIIGAEGGFAAEEIDLLKRSGAVIVGLGKRILRTETASIIGCAMVTQILKA